MMRRLSFLLFTVLGACLAIAWFAPAEMPANGPVYLAPSATPTYPACLSEDGAGQALCWWDAQTMGNGEGQSIISGDCAPDYVGGQAVSDLCVQLFNTKSIEVTMADGFTKTLPNGADLVAECVEEWNLMDEADAIKNGFTLQECFKAQFNS